jgi:DNA-binding NarL/FixJ family response regulator
MKGRIRVFIADDHAIVRRGLRLMIAECEDMEVTGEAENGVQAVQMVREAPPDVVLMDISMPDRNGIDALKMIRKELPRLPVLILSMYPEDQYAVRAMKAGAAGYLSKHRAPEQLIAAIRLVACGKKYVSAAVAEALAHAISAHDGDRPLHERLSDREYQTLCMIASGKTLTQIAEALNLSVKTVSVYRTRLLEKMNLHTSAELTHYGIRNGLVE